MLREYLNLGLTGSEMPEIKQRRPMYQEILNDIYTEDVSINYKLKTISKILYAETLLKDFLLTTSVEANTYIEITNLPTYCPTETCPVEFTIMDKDKGYLYMVNEVFVMEIVNGEKKII